MKVFVYFNLHKKCWSVKALEGPKKGLVINHVNEIALKDITFKVSESGRQRVLKEKRKNVHAGVIGTIINDILDIFTSKQVSYNPYKASNFYYKETEEPVFFSSFAYLSEKKVWIA